MTKKVDYATPNELSLEETQILFEIVEPFVTLGLTKVAFTFEELQERLGIEDQENVGQKLHDLFANLSLVSVTEKTDTFLHEYLVFIARDFDFENEIVSFEINWHFMEMVDEGFDWPHLDWQVLAAS